MAKIGNFRFLLLVLILADQVADLPSWCRNLVVKNDNFRFLLLELILVDQVADQLADLPPPVEASIGEVWQFLISTVRAYIGRSSGRLTGRCPPL